MPPKASRSFAKNWCWTYNRPDETPDDVWEQLKERMKLVGTEDGVEFLVFQAERGSGGREHLQGYIMLNRRCSLAGVKRDFFHVNEIHLEVARGTPQQNISYCSKNDDRLDGPFEFGAVTSGAGARTDLYEAAVVVQTRGVAAVAADMPDLYIKYHRGLKAYAQLHQRLNAPAMREVPYVAVIWGSTGLGKSHTAFTMDDRGETFVVPIQNKGTLWFDGYEGQRTLIFDDFDPTTVPYRTLLRLLDRYRLEIAVKGDFVLAQWQNIILTSNHPPSLWYPPHEAGQYEGGPLERRLELVYGVSTREECNDFQEVFLRRFFPDEPEDAQNTATDAPGVAPEVGGNTEPPPPVQASQKNEDLPDWAVAAQMDAEALLGGFAPEDLDEDWKKLNAELDALGADSDITEPFSEFDEYD